jgi:hypothetical protein
MSSTERKLEMKDDEVMTVLARVDMSGCQPDAPYPERLKQCEEMGLIETVMHGEHEYGRMTQRGINVFRTLNTLMNHRLNPENELKEV